jgi:hypothetical protein
MKSLMDNISFALFGTTEMRNISLGLINRVLKKHNLDGFQYRNAEYFNDTDSYVFYDIGLKKCFISKTEKDGKIWYTKESLQYRCTSIPCYKLTPEKTFFH